MLFKELETQRLILKNISMEDRDFIYRQFSNDFINRYLFDAEPLIDIQGADEIIDFYLQLEPRLQHQWILVTKEGEKIGTCGFHCWDTAEGICDMGYDLNPDYCGKGYMIETINAILKFAKNEMKLRKVKACIYPENEKSIKLAKKAGFKYHGDTEIVVFREKEYLHEIYVLELEN
jgi:ribosomal-protein-alanine N-acetyltransferase